MSRPPRWPAGTRFLASTAGVLLPLPMLMHYGFAWYVLAGSVLILAAVVVVGLCVDVESLVSRLIVVFLLNFSATTLALFLLHFVSLSLR